MQPSSSIADRNWCQSGERKGSINEKNDPQACWQISQMSAPGRHTLDTLLFQLAPLQAPVLPNQAQLSAEHRCRRQQHDGVLPHILFLQPAPFRPCYQTNPTSLQNSAGASAGGSGITASSRGASGLPRSTHFTLLQNLLRSPMPNETNPPLCRTLVQAAAA